MTDRDEYREFRKLAESFGYEIVSHELAAIHDPGAWKVTLKKGSYEIRIARFGVPSE